MQRGVLIVFEGGDRCGKSTQSSKLAESMKAKNIPVEHLHFPNRDSRSGALIDGFLQKQYDLDAHAVHLLFAINRWESAKTIHEKLASGVTLIVDRYSYSGVAYSAAKNVPGLDLDWCMQPDKGLPQPDLVIFLKLSPDIAAERSSFGSERYESIEFQKLVMARFDEIRGSNWIELDASKNTEELHEEIKIAAANCLESTCRTETINKLWQNAGR